MEFILTKPNCVVNVNVLKVEGYVRIQRLFNLAVVAGVSIRALVRCLVAQQEKIACHFHRPLVVVVIQFAPKYL